MVKQLNSNFDQPEMPYLNTNRALTLPGKQQPWVKTTSMEKHSLKKGMNMHYKLSLLHVSYPWLGPQIVAEGHFGNIHNNILSPSKIISFRLS